MFKQISEPTQLEIRYLFNAPRERVFNAWTEPEMLKKWFRAGPDFVPVLAEVDLRVGGRFRLGMQAQGSAQASIATGVYQLIERPNKLVFTWSWEGEAASETLMSIEFKSMGEKTELVLIHSKFTSPEQRDQHLQGWTGCLNALLSFLDQDQSEG